MADAPASGAPLPIGYTPDTLQNYYKSLLAPIDQDTAFQTGKARTDAAAGGMEGTATETGGVAAANYYGGLRKDAAASGLAFNMAGLANQDALIKQQQDWQGGQNNLNRAELDADRTSRETLARMGYDFKGREDQINFRHGYQGQIAGLGANIAGQAIGNYL